MSAGRQAAPSPAESGATARRLARGAALFALLLALGTAWPGPAARAGEPPPEPAGYRLDTYRAPVPATLAGARVLDAAAALAIWRNGAAAFIDVLPRPPRPAQLPPGTLWRDQPHASIPGALWLPNVGFGALSDATDAYFRAGLAMATRGDVNAPVVIFCQRDCWMSWNAAKRALAYGYREVAWFPEGTDGWSDAGLALAPVEPRP